MGHNNLNISTDSLHFRVGDSEIAKIAGKDRGAYLQMCSRIRKYSFSPRCRAFRHFRRQASTRRAWQPFTRKPVQPSPNYATLCPSYAPTYIPPLAIYIVKHYESEIFSRPSSAMLARIDVTRNRGITDPACPRGRKSERT